MSYRHVQVAPKSTRLACVASCREEDGWPCAQRAMDKLTVLSSAVLIAVPNEPPSPPTPDWLHGSRAIVQPLRAVKTSKAPPKSLLDKRLVPMDGNANGGRNSPKSKSPLGKKGAGGKQPNAVQAKPAKKKAALPSIMSGKRGPKRTSSAGVSRLYAWFGPKKSHQHRVLHFVRLLLPFPLVSRGASLHVTHMAVCCANVCHALAARVHGGLVLAAITRQ
jgi:hypothetical protein